MKALLAAGGLTLVMGCRAAVTNPEADGERAPRRLSETPEEFPGVFSVVRAVMALPDGRLVVSDPQENRIHLLDFSKGTSEQLGRIGEGPREFRRAGGLYRGPGGGVLSFDQGLMRLLPVAPSGTLEDVIGLPTGGIPGSWLARGPDPLFFDSLGHTYDAVGSGGFTAPTAGLLRYRPGSRADTITQLLKRVTKALEARGNRTGVYQEVLFSPEDAWAVAPDGWIAVVRAAPYRVEWFPVAGSSVAGPIIAHEPVPVTQAEKELIASGTAGSRGRITVTIGRVVAGGPPATRPSVPAPIPVEDLLFARVKTPVNLRGGRWPLLDESGRLWVERSLPAGARIAVFDVFDRAGNLADRIELPAGLRLVGFDQRWLYTVRVDADDLEHLHRFPLPPDQAPLLP